MYTLIGRDGKPYESGTPGTLGGHRKDRIYGTLDCPGAARAIARGGYVTQRVFFADEDTAIAAGYRPCAVCLRRKYDAWKAHSRKGSRYMSALIPRPRRAVAPGAVLVPDWLGPDEQRHLVGACREWARGPVPMRAARLPTGHAMSVRTVCLGWHWQPYRYSRIADDAGGGRVLPVPEWLAQLGRRAVADAYGDPAAGASYDPDAALINFYDDTARMGMHRDQEERADAPVVSLSIGDTCTFRFGNPDTRNKPYTDVELCSGDLFVFGGPSRFAYHGVPKTFPGTADPACGLTRGRLNITLRVTGLEDAR